MQSCVWTQSVSLQQTVVGDLFYVDTPQQSVQRAARCPRWSCRNHLRRLDALHTPWAASPGRCLSSERLCSGLMRKKKIPSTPHHPQPGKAISSGCCDLPDLAQLHQQSRGWRCSRDRQEDPGSSPPIGSEESRRRRSLSATFIYVSIILPQL